MTLTLLDVDLSKAVVAHLVHEAVEEDGGALSVHSELPLYYVMIMTFDMNSLQPSRVQVLLSGIRTSSYHSTQQREPNKEKRNKH